MNCHMSNTKFISIIKIYILNSFIICVNRLIVGVLFTIQKPVLYENETISFPLFTSYDFVFYIVYIRSNFFLLPYTFCSILDIYISYTRIQVFKPNFTLFKETPVTLVYFLMPFWSISKYSFIQGENNGL